MGISAGKDNRGIALVVTLTIITVLVTVSLELNRQVRGAVTDSAVFRDRTTLIHMIRSGVTVAGEILVRDKQDTEADSIQEDWAHPEKIEAYLAELPFPDGGLTVRISDEMARIQINALVAFPEGREFNETQQKLWGRFIELILTRQEEMAGPLFSEPIEPAAIINPVKDWLDSEDDDSITGLSGAEDPYYMDLSPSYSCRNGPVRHINELLRIKGITGDLFYSSKPGIPGISRYLTVFGLKEVSNGFTYPGKINLNTAEMPVIAGLLPIGHEFLAPEIVAWREEQEGGEYIHDLFDAQWYQQVPGLSDVEIDPDILTTQSDIFRIDCKAELNDLSLAAHVVVKREQESETGKWTCRVLRWVWD